MVQARDGELPANVSLDAKHRVLDAIAAVVSGARLPPGRMALEFARAQGGPREASLLATNFKTTAIVAALANGMCAHADETDDAEPSTATHPGSAVIPAAMAIGERENRSGLEVLRAVVLGYDLCVRLVRALGYLNVRNAHRSAEAYGGSIGAAAAAASLLRLDELQMAHALSYAIQQSSGVYTWPRDTDHIEKSFDFAGQSARNGVTAALMISLGFTGVDAVFDGEHNALVALSSDPHPVELTLDLGRHFSVSDTTIKAHAVGLPIQAAVDALSKLLDANHFRAEEVARLTAYLPPNSSRVVDNREMPDVNLQYIMAVMLIDGRLTFEASHAFERMRDPMVRKVRERVELAVDASLSDIERSARVSVVLNDGRRLSEFTRFPPGSRENPLTPAAIHAKARRLMEPVIGPSRADDTIAAVRDLEHLRSMRDLAALLTFA